MKGLLGEGGVLLAKGLGLLGRGLLEEGLLEKG